MSVQTVVLSGNLREVAESPYPVGANEIIRFKLDTLPAGGAPSNPSVTILLLPDLTNMSTSALSGAPSVEGDFVVAPALQCSTLTLGKDYRLEVKFTTGLNTFVRYCILKREL